MHGWFIVDFYQATVSWDDKNKKAGVGFRPVQVSTSSLPTHREPTFSSLLSAAGSSLANIPWFGVDIYQATLSWDGETRQVE